IVGPSWLLVPLWIWFGVGMHGLLNLMHETAHNHVFRRRWACELLGGWLLGPLTLADFEVYRQRHWRHHRHLGVEGDTKDAYLIDVRGAGMLRFLGRCLTLREAAAKFRSTRGTGDQDAARSPAAWLPRVVVVQVALAASLLLTALVARDGELGASVIAAACAW